MSEPNELLSQLNELLKTAVQYNASDIHMKTMSVPTFRINGAMHRVDEFGVLRPERINPMLASILNEEQRKMVRDNVEVDLSYTLPSVARFRVNVYKQRNTLCAVFRTIPFSVKSFEELVLPPVIKKIAEFQRGLVLVTGTTGSGKSTTMAAMIDYINSTRACNIITIEDPIEFLLRDKKSAISQREIGIDTHSFSKALRGSLRQDPDVIMVGEMRDLETIEIALTAAETGHLVISTLHTLNAAETINRIISVFPPNGQAQIRHQLGSVLAAAISQRLIKVKGGKGRVPAIEVLVATPLVKDIILDSSRFGELREVIEKGYLSYGMQTFDQSIFQLYKDGHISAKEALENASNPEDLKLRMEGVTTAGGGDWSSFDKDEDEDKSYLNQYQPTDAGDY
ncbi:type IV pilus twitching motility protein PilT [bacterium]|nr:type IV pilus twitching motility protein PilT [bacterium]